MKIDFELLEKMVEAGASGAVVLAFLKEQHAKGEKQREADRLRKTSGNLRNSSENSGKSGKSTGNMRKAAENNWDQILTTYKQVGRWSKWAGPDPESPACQCPRELLEKYGIPSAAKVSA